MKSIFKKSNLLMFTLIGTTLVACNSGAGNSGNLSSPASGNNSNIPASAPPQVNLEDIKSIFQTFGTVTANDSSIDLQTAVNMINGTAKEQLARLDSLPLSGLSSALTAIKSVPQVTLTTSQVTQAQYNEALFAALFVADVTDSSSGSDGTSDLGTITLENSINNLAMISHRFFGGYRLPQQHYTWSFNPGTLETIVNTPASFGTPDYLNVHQGAVGDCYYLSTLSAYINLHGAVAITKRFSSENNGGYNFN